MSWNPYVQDRTDLNDLLDWLEDLPDETDPEYETRVGQINSTVELLEEIASDPDRDPRDNLRGVLPTGHSPPTKRRF